MLRRFEPLPTSVWMFARCKLRLDPMFKELPQLIEDMPEPATILDIGCGYGVAGRALLEWFENSTLIGIDPSGRRVRFASRVFGERGRAIRAAAPDLPFSELPDRLDAVFLLDVIHYLDDAKLELTLRRVRERLPAGRQLVIRVSLPEAPAKSILFRLEAVERALTGGRVFYRSARQIEAILRDTGFYLSRKQMSGHNRELCWFIAAADRVGHSVRLKMLPTVAKVRKASPASAET